MAHFEGAQDVGAMALNDRIGMVVNELLCGGEDKPEMLKKMFKLDDNQLREACECACSAEPAVPPHLARTPHPTAAAAAAAEAEASSMLTPAAAPQSAWWAWPCRSRCRPPAAPWRLHNGRRPRPGRTG